jgi:hypothetical protein
MMKMMALKVPGLEWLQDSGDDEGTEFRSALVVPPAASIHLRRDAIYSRLTLSPRRVRHSRQTLLQFVQLAEAPRSAVLDFARRWGVIYLGDCGLPIGHMPIQEGCPLAFHDIPKPNELSRAPLAVWRRFAWQARGMLRIAGEIGSPARVRRDDIIAAWDARWMPFTNETEAQVMLEVIRKASPKRDESSLSKLLVSGLRSWINVGGVQFGIWNTALDGRFRPELGVWRYGLIGSLAILLLREVTGQTVPRYCHNCRRQITDSKPRNPNRRSYCDRSKCKRASRAQASADYRERQLAPDNRQGGKAVERGGAQGG